MTFAKTQKEVKKPMLKAQERAACISEATWSMEDKSTTISCNHPVEQQGLHTASRHFKDSIKEDMRWRVILVGKDIK